MEEKDMVLGGQSLLVDCSLVGKNTGLTYR